MDERHNLWPVPVRELVDALAELTVRCDTLARTVGQLERARRTAKAAGLRANQFFETAVLPEEVIDSFSLAGHVALRRKRYPRRHRLVLNLCDRTDELTFALRRWRAAIKVARFRVAAASPWMDTPGLAVADNWCVGLQGELAQLGGLAPLEAVGDMPESIELADLRRLSDTLSRRLSKLKSVPNVPGADPGTTSRRHGVPARPLLNDLRKELGGIAGAAVIRRIRRGAGMETSARGRVARLHRYSSDEVNRMIDAVMDGPFNRKAELIDAWSRWGTRGGYRAIIAAREAVR